MRASSVPCELPAEEIGGDRSLCSSSDRLETLSAETERTFASNDAIEPRVFDGDAAAVP
jgi:hypothetical protein